MDFLKEILGEELFAQVAEKINAHNGNEANKEKQIKIANLGGGEYVGKAKHDALQAQFESRGQELTNANNLIAELQKAAKGDETLQAKVTEYQNQAAQLQTKLNETLIESGLRIAFMEAGGIDIDYLIYKAKNGEKPLELGEDQKVKGIDDIVSGLKTSSPNQFESGTNGRKVLGNNRLPGGDDRPVTVTKEDFAKMGYNDRLKLKQENEQLFRQLTAH